MPVIGVAGLAGIAAALFLVMLAASWDTTFGPLLKNLADAIDALPSLGVLGHRIGLGPVASAIRHLEAQSRRAIGDAVGHVAGPLVMLLRAVSNVVTYPARELRALAEDTAGALWNLRRLVIPAMIAAHIAWIPRHLAALEREVAGLLRRAPVHIVHDITRVATKYATTVVRQAIAIPFPRIGAVEREAGALGKRLRALERRFGPAALAGLVTAVVARTAFRWVRCSKVGKAGRHLCGINEGLLDTLLADTLLIVSTVSIVEFANELLAVEDFTVGAIKRGVKELRDVKVPA